jgi:diaminobutyrate-2-oxoglutarate transaminase
MLKVLDAVDARIREVEDILPYVSTALPGPSSRKLLDLQEHRESNARSYPRRLPIAIRSAHGALIEDMDGNTFLDFLGGAGVAVIGHNHPKVVRAIKDQVDDLSNALDFPTPTKEAFTTELFSILPPSLQDCMKVHFCGPTGSDAVEAAIKLCKYYSGRHGVVAFQGSYHGMTGVATSLSSEKALKEIIRPPAPDVSFAPYPYLYRCPSFLALELYVETCLESFRNIFTDTHSGVATPAAVILEAIQGEGGTIVAPRQFLTEVRRITSEHKVPLIVDEIQSGMGRTGKWFAFDHHGILPDVITLSKGIGGGLPLSVILYRKEMDVWSPGSHIGTFRGCQLAMAAGLATIQVIKEENLLDRAAVMGARLLQVIRSLAGQFTCVGDVRGLGMMAGMEIVKDRTAKESWPEMAKEIQVQALQRGLMVELGGRRDSVVRLLPPINIEPEQIECAGEILGEALGAATREIET